MKSRFVLKANRVRIVPGIVYYYLQRDSSVCHTFVYTFEYRKFFFEHLFRWEYKAEQAEWLERMKVQYSIFLLRSVLTDNFDPHDPWLLEIKESARRLGFPLKNRLFLWLFTSSLARRVILFAHRYHLKDKAQVVLGRKKKMRRESVRSFLRKVEPR